MSALPSARSLSVLSFTLVACVVMSPRPACAQERVPIALYRSPGVPASAWVVAETVAGDALRAAAGDDTAATDARQETASRVPWSQLRQLPTTEDIRVGLDDGTVYRGAFRQADDESLSLVVAGQPQRVSRPRVRYVWAARGTHRRRHVWLGLAIGGATTILAVGLHCRGETSACKEVAPAYFYPLSGAGAGVGAILPARTIWQEIYDSTGS